MTEDVIEPSADAGVASALLRYGFHVRSDGVGSDDAGRSGIANGTVVVTLQGELDMATAPGLGRALTEALDARPPAMVLDLTDLTFLDSTGIRILVTACRRAETDGCPFVLRSPRRSVLKALRLTGVDRLMVIEPHPGP
jgi:anti-sigma B factor antagonist